MTKEQFTTIDGVVTACITDYAVSITLHHDSGHISTMTIPAHKFAWIVEAYNKRHARKDNVNDCSQP